MKDFDWTAASTAWDAAGLRYAPVFVADDAVAAERIQAACDGPVWVRGPITAEAVLCAVVENPADLPLAFGQIRKRTGTPVVRVQRAIAGPQFRVVGFQIDGRFRPVEILRDEVPRGMYRVAMTRVTPPEMRGADYMQMLDTARRAARAFETEDRPLVLEFVLSAQGPVLTWVDSRVGVHPADTLLLQQAYGIDLAADAQRVAEGRPPRPLSTRDLGAALAWLPTHGGDVSAITGVDEARAMPGVVQVHIRAQLGDCLGHVIDTLSRDAGGYVLAVGPTAAIARQRANAARFAIEIHANAVRA